MPNFYLKKKRAKQLTFDIEQKRALKGVFVLKKKKEL